MEGLAERIGALLGARPVAWEPRAAPWQPAGAVDGGNERFSVLLEDGRRVFVKAAQAEHTAAWPPSTQTVRETFPVLFGRWRVVEQHPEPFLATGIRPRRWLEQALPTLIAAADAVPADGDDLLHLDVRSDNLCFHQEAAILVDWNWCSTGNADLDVAAWLPSLAVEGGPQPWEVLPGAAEYAAFMAGVWAAVVGLPPPTTAPTVRALQRSQLEVALTWCERELGL